MMLGRQINKCIKGYTICWYKTQHIMAFTYFTLFTSLATEKVLQSVSVCEKLSIYSIFVFTDSLFEGECCFAIIKFNTWTFTGHNISV